GDIGAFGRSDYDTPALDRLVSEGVRLTQAYAAAPVCSPTRVALMTGAYPARNPVGLYEPLTTHPLGLAPEPPTLPRRLKDAGYETALIGKWHLGTLPEFHPLRHGFDEFYGFLGAAADYASHVDTEHHTHLFHDGEAPARVEGYLTDLFTERAVQCMTPERSAPFFLKLQYNAPHWPWQAPGDPPFPDSLAWKGGGSPETYARMVESLDAGIGRVLDALAAHGLEGNTLVIFTSDNGGERFSDMGPLRGAKMTLWEGGIRVAAAARWPGIIPAGTETDQVAVTMDWTATLLAAAGIELDADAAPDGIDLMPVLTGAAGPCAAATGSTSPPRTASSSSTSRPTPARRATARTTSPICSSDSGPRMRGGRRGSWSRCRSIRRGREGVCGARENGNPEAHVHRAVIPLHAPARTTG